MGRTTVNPVVTIIFRKYDLPNGSQLHYVVNATTPLLLRLDCPSLVYQMQQGFLTSQNSLEQ